MKEITLTQGKVAVVDDFDYERVSAHKWHAQKHTNSDTWYALTNVRVYPDRYHPQRRILLHRFILDAPPDKRVDHIDGDGLNCVRSNIRLCQSIDNSHNRRMPKTNTSGYKGICYYPKIRKWGAFICFNLEQIYLGVFVRSDDAARAYDAKARELFGEFANLNFPNEVISWDEAYSKRSQPPRTSQYTGVCWDKRAKNWMAYIRHNKKNVYMGRFVTEVEAARAYDAKAIELFGERANTNFPISDYASN